MQLTDFLDKLKERHACKAMNGEVVPEEKINRILEAIRLAPTSSGLQPFEIIVVTNTAIKAKIREVAWNQSPVTECSHLLVFAAWSEYTPERINYMFDLTNEIRGFKNEGFENYRQFLLDTYGKLDKETHFQQASKQAYLAAMTAMTQAIYDSVDSVPMEGFEPEKVDDILDLSTKNLRSCLLLPLGYHHPENDWMLKLAKVRKPMEKLVQNVT